MRPVFPVYIVLAMFPSPLDALITGCRMFHHVRLKPLGFNHFDLLLFLMGLHQAEGSSTEMSSLNWKPFVYGGMASIVAEFGELLIFISISAIMILMGDDGDDRRNVTVSLCHYASFIQH